MLGRPLALLRNELDALDRAVRSSHAAEDESARFDACATLVVAAICLTLMEYLAGPRVLAELTNILHALQPRLPDWYDLRESRWVSLLDLTLWVATRALGFVALPALALRYCLRRPVASLGLAWPERAADLRPYAWLFLAMLPLLAIASLRPDFRAYYPFYRRAAESWFDLLLWEAMYGFQFFCVEFFFRGFLLRGTYARLGSLAIFAAMVPYCMVHFSKPLLEVLGAIPAGLVLGALALRSGSIWGGVLLHVLIAWTMDGLAIAQGPGFPERLLPP